MNKPVDLTIMYVITLRNIYLMNNPKEIWNQIIFVVSASKASDQKNPQKCHDVEKSLLPKSFLKFSNLLLVINNGNLRYIHTCY